MYREGAGLTLRGPNHDFFYLIFLSFKNKNVLKIKTRLIYEN